MDLASTCKDKLTYFRIKELKDVLTQLGLGKQGKKQDLVDRILAAVSDDQGSNSYGWAKKNSLGKEGVAKIIDDTYRKLQVHGATDLASKGQNGSNSSSGKPKKQKDDSVQLDMVKVRCPCGSSLHTDSMIKCEDPRCDVWQHMICVIIPEKPVDGLPPEVPAQFYCDVCRVNRADPFWVSLAHPLHSVKLTPSNLTSEGGNPVQTVEKTFNLTRADRDLLQKKEFDLQAWCILLNDKVSFRMQWPQYADLQVNGVPVRTINRPGSQLLGINGRDDGPAITTCSREGMNKISLSGCDARIFCLGVRIVRRRSLQQVLNLIPKEANGERLEEALARVRRCISGGATAENADSDSDLEVVADSVSVNLRCPMSGSRMKIAGRFRPCVHMGCFDLDTFVELNERSRKWQCPICLMNYSVEHIVIDPYFSRITSMMRDCGEDVTEIDVKPDGSWRARNETEHRDLAQWHNPDGSPCVLKKVEMQPTLELKPIKQEGGSNGYTPLKLGIKRNRNGIWQVSKPEETHLLSFGEKIENNSKKIMPMSSSATGSCRDEDASVNQDDRGHLDFSSNNGHELNSTSLKFNSTYGGDSNNVPSAAPSIDPDVIVLSDSEEDNVLLISPETALPETNGVPFTIPPPRDTDPYLGDSELGTSGTPSLGLFHNSNDDFGAGVSLWSLPPCPQDGPGFQLFGTDTEVGSLVDGQHTTGAHLNDYGLRTGSGTGTGAGFESPSQVPDTSEYQSNTDITGGLVDNPLAFGGEDPSLQIFLPSRPAAGVKKPDLRENMSNIGRAKDWISLSLGGGGSHCESDEPADGLDSRNNFTSKNGRVEYLANTDSLFPSMDKDRPDKSALNKRSSAGPFSQPDQHRLARSDFYLSIDTDSESSSQL